MSPNGLHLRPGDPGGPGGGGSGITNQRNGEYTGALVPSFMDPEGTLGQLHYLKLSGTSGQILTDPFLLRLSVEKHIGGPIAGAFKENRGLTYVLKVRSQEQVKQLLRMKQLSDGTGITIEEHSSLNQVRCVVTNPDTVGLSDQYLVENLANQNVKEVRRIKRRNEKGEPVNSPVMILTINGTVIPEHIDFGWTRCRTRNYYPSPMLCFRCWTFGHTGKRCSATQRTCGKCSKTHDEELTPNIAEGATAFEVSRGRTNCDEPAHCKNCEEWNKKREKNEKVDTKHAVSSRECPIYKKENAIQHLRVDLGISYPAARRDYETREAAMAKKKNPQTDKSFAGIVNASKDCEMDEMRSMVKNLLEDSKRKDERIAQLERALEKRSVNTRLDSAKDHGPTAELVRQVAELTATVRQLQDNLTKKDAFIKTLLTTRSHPVASPSNSTISATETEKANMTHSHSSTEEIIVDNVTLQPFFQVQEWIKNSTHIANDQSDYGRESTPKE